MWIYTVHVEVSPTCFTTNWWTVSVTATTHLKIYDVIYNFIPFLVTSWLHMDDSDNFSPQTAAHKNYITLLSVYGASVSILQPFLETVCTETVVASFWSPILLCENST
jgi:hypothetical protein